VAELDPELAQNAAAAVEALRQQAGSMRISPEQAEQLRQQAEKLRDSLKAEDFKLDQNSSTS